MAIRKIDILAHADYHGQFREDNETPGLSRFYCAIEEVRQKNPKLTLLLDAGDESKCLWHGSEVYKGLKLIKTDCMTIGNHEFDAGRKELEQCLDYAKDLFPIVSSNVVYKETGQFLKGVQPYTIIEKEGIKFGIIGLATEYTPYMVEKSSFEDFKIIDSVTQIRKYVPELKEKGCDIIILLSHYPFYLDDSGELFDVFNQVKDLPIDVFIGGHIPGDYGKVEEDTCILKGGFHGCSLPHGELWFDDETKEVVKRQCSVIDVLKDCHQHDEEIDKFVLQATKDYEYYFTEVLAQAKQDIIMHLSRESAMGNLISDGVRKAAKTDFAYFNCTSCGRLLPKGPITRFSINKMLAFNEYIQTTTMKGKDIYELFEIVHYPEIFGNNADIMFSGFNVKIDHNKPANQKVVYIRDENGNDIDKEKEYSVATSKYMSTGGNGTRDFCARFVFQQLDIKIHDALKDYFEELKEIAPPPLGRYIFVGSPENDNSPW